MLPPALEIIKLQKSFGKFSVLNDLSLRVESGEIYGFLGPNGAGKSTTIRILLSLVNADSGSVNIFGQSIKKVRHQSLSNIGAMIEKPDFYLYLSAEDNLKILARMTGTPFNRIDFALDMVGLLHRKQDKVKKYSQGMKQRLGLAQAILNSPKLLILDEPTNGLDPSGMKEVRDLITKFAEDGITVFLSSHLLQEVEKVCTSMAIINDGYLIKEGKVKDLLTETSEQTIRINANPLEKTIAILKELSYVSHISTDESSVIFVTPKDYISSVINYLVSRNIQIESVVPQTTLEDYFLSLTDPVTPVRESVK
ncbi:MAG: ABC transporter ATP-binding protein [Fidelibacterota bacterium]